MKYIGVDACKKGWFAVCFEPDKRWTIEIFDSIDNLWNVFQKDFRWKSCTARQAANI